MGMCRVHVMMSREMLDRITAEVGLGTVSRGEFVRWAVEQALGDQSQSEPHPSAPAEQPMFRPGMTPDEVHAAAGEAVQLSRADAFRRATQGKKR